MNSYCIAPFIKINQEPGGRYRVCHWHKNNLEKEYDSIQDAFNGEEMESLRTKMLNNEYIEDCSKCYKTEELGILSHRKVLTDIHFNRKLRFDKALTFGKIQNLEISFDNACNFKCVSCAPDASSAWEDEVKEDWEYLGDHYKVFPRKVTNEQVKNSLNEELISGLNYLNLLGGEPLFNRNYDESFFDLLDSSYDFEHALFSMSTNNSITPKGRWYKFLQKANNLIINISIDGIDEVGEWVRYGFKQDRWDSNLEVWKKLVKNKPVKEITAGFKTGIMLYFIHHTLNMFNLKKVLEKYDVQTLYEPLHGPEHLDPSYLPDSVKEDVYNEIEYYDKYHRDFVYNSLNMNSYNEEHCNMFVKFVEYLIVKRDVYPPDECLTVYKKLKVI